MGFTPIGYVGVHTRVEQAHEKYKDLTIETEFDIKDSIVVFKAIVKFEGRVFNGSSFGELGKEKAFEKLETVAVGRALAFAGFSIKEGIASKDEMEVFEEKQANKWLNFDNFKEIVEAGNTTEQDIAKIIKEDGYKLSSFAKNAIRKYLNEGILDKNLFFKQA